ncbi:TPA: anion permease [Escherichia coli]|uniref:inorganic phosphate transporter n=1 Tax=Escherichia coli TaxID=562 RepID=UPI001119DFB4|nr:inorganic phosphate transporter [Escherichia coli]HCN9392707.1 anion permease [Escherichia coli]HDD9125024.1 anion permease [Escherichia coli]
MLNLFVGLDIYTGLLLLLALAFVLFYEAINGFHDTANAVAAVIYTRAMQPQLAVVMAAFFNFFGVLLGGLSVAYAIVHMLPTDLLLNMGSTHGLAMVFSMLLAAIIWNLGTWFFGLPASSSHTLIGAIIGIGLTNALLTGSSVMDALNLREVTKIFSSLIVSPIVGLVMLVLVGIAPAGFVVNMNASGYEITRTRDAVTNFEHYLQQHPELPQKLIAMEPPLPAASTDGTQVTEFHCHPANTFDAIARVKTMLPGNMESYEPLSVSQRSQLRRIMLCISDTSAKLAKLPGVSKEDQNLLKKLRSDMLSTIEYAPVWIIMAVALALGIGTMIGWRRVAMTIGEKIGKRGMTYAQGMAAQMTAAVSIGLASYIGMPVSTTHVLSSAVAGTMVVDGGGLQRKTVTSILMAWVFTLPAAIFLSGGLYWIALQLI